MRPVVARCFSELSGRRTRALDGRSTREEDPGATAALHASPAARPPVWPCRGAVFKTKCQTCQLETTRIRNLSDWGRRGADDRRSGSARCPCSASSDAPVPPRGGTQCVRGAGLACEMSSSPAPLDTLMKTKRETQVGSSSHARCTSAAPRTRPARTRREVINHEPAAPLACELSSSPRCARHSP